MLRAEVELNACGEQRALQADYCLFVEGETAAVAAVVTRMRASNQEISALFGTNSSLLPCVLQRARRRCGGHFGCHCGGRAILSRLHLVIHLICVLLLLTEKETASGWARRLSKFMAFTLCFMNVASASICSGGDSAVVGAVAAAAASQRPGVGRLPAHQAARPEAQVSGSRNAFSTLSTLKLRCPREQQWKDYHYAKQHGLKHM